MGSDNVGCIKNIDGCLYYFYDGRWFPIGVPDIKIDENTTLSASTASTSVDEAKETTSITGCFSLKDDGLHYSHFAPAIKHVIFCGPATVVFWDDNTKTVVKCMQGDKFDYETGVYVAMLKKLFGESYSDFKHDVKKHVNKQREADMKIAPKEESLWEKVANYWDNDALATKEVIEEIQGKTENND